MKKLQVELFHMKYGFVFRVRYNYTFLLLNLCLGYGQPVNSFAEKGIWFMLHYPQRIVGIKTFKGLQLQKYWGSKLNHV